MTEADLLDALRNAKAPTKRDDDGRTLAELADAIYGNASSVARMKVSDSLRKMLASGQVIRGKRFHESVSGAMVPSCVFRLAKAKR